MCIRDSICAKLFELDNLASISFGACKNGQYEEPQNPYEDSIALESPCIFFKNKSITDFIAEWNEICLLYTSRCV